MERGDYRRENGENRHGVSICIPRVFKNIGKERILGVLEKEGLGEIMRIDLLSVDERFNIAYVHFKENSWREQDVLDALVQGDSVKLYYEDGKPWYWKLSISKARRPKHQGERRRRLVIDKLSVPASPKHAPASPKHAPASPKSKFSNDAPNYGRSNKVYQGKATATSNKNGLSGFFNAIERKRTYESACKLAYERRKELPETFEFPEEGASEGIKKAFTRAVYSALGM